VTILFPLVDEVGERGLIMSRSRREWRQTPQRPSRVPQAVKDEVCRRAQDLVDSALKPRHVKPAQKVPRYNYVVDIFTKWHGRFFYFVSRYACPGPNAISPFFDAGFARLEYLGSGLFGLAYMRHTGQWWQVYTDVSLNKALSVIRKDSLFHP
jgi:hypothetical protein